MRAQLCSEIGGMAIRGGGCPGASCEAWWLIWQQPRQKRRRTRGGGWRLKARHNGHHLTQVGTVQLFLEFEQAEVWGAGSSAKTSEALSCRTIHAVGLRADGCPGDGVWLGCFRTSVTLALEGIMGATDCPVVEDESCQAQGAVDERSLRSSFRDGPVEAKGCRRFQVLISVSGELVVSARQIARQILALEPLFARSSHVVGGSFAVLFATPLTSEDLFWGC